MANRENKTSMQMVRGANQTLSGATPNASEWFDTRGFNSVTLALMTGTVTDAGTAEGFSAVIQESDTTAAADATEVVSSEIVGDLSDFTVTSDSADNTLLGAVAYLGNARYVRFYITGTTGTAAVVTPIAILGDYAQYRDFVGDAVAAT